MDFAHGCSLQKCQLRQVSIYSRVQSPRYGSHFQIPASRLKKQFPHPCLLRRHSRAGGNPDLRLSEIFNDYRSMDFTHRYGLQKYQLRGSLNIFSRAKPTLRQPLADTRKSSEKNSSYIPASHAVIPAQAGIQASDFQKYSGLNLNQDKATKPQTVQIVRQGEATPYWFKVDPLYSTITAVWTLPTDAVCRNIDLGRAFMFYLRNPPYFQTTF